MARDAQVIVNLASDIEVSLNVRKRRGGRSMLEKHGGGHRHVRAGNLKPHAELLEGTEASGEQGVGRLELTSPRGHRGAHAARSRKLGEVADRLGDLLGIERRGLGRIEIVEGQVGLGEPTTGLGHEIAARSDGIGLAQHGDQAVASFHRTPRKHLEFATKLREQHTLATETSILGETGRLVEACPRRAEAPLAHLQHSARQERL